MTLDEALAKLAAMLDAIIDDRREATERMFRDLGATDEEVDAVLEQFAKDSAALRLEAFTIVRALAETGSPWVH